MQECSYASAVSEFTCSVTRGWLTVHPGSTLDRAWRVIGTGLSFSLFGLGGLLLGVFVFPLLFVLYPQRPRRQAAARALISRLFRCFIAIMRGLGVLSHELRGAQHLDPGEGRLVLANHPTLIDIVFLMSLYPGANCVIKQALRRNPFTLGPVTSAGYISNNDTAAMLQACTACLANGESLIMFPEGTRSVVGQPLDFKLGAAEVALADQAPIQLVSIDCTPPTLAKGQPWYHVAQRRPHFTITVSAPVSADLLIGAHGNAARDRRSLNIAMKDLLAGLARVQ
jgi:1-acyl-sn-glycerol-3-phosphate acyltransferase